MPEIKATIINKVGLHARPASLFVQTAKRYKSDIRVSCGDRSANAKSILGVLALGANQGAEIAIVAQGEDATEALTALRTLLASNMGEAA